MWECFHCGFQNVDAAPVCAKCRARKPLPGETPKGRSFYAAELAAQTRFADQVMATAFPVMPTPKQLQEKWHGALRNPVEFAEELARAEQRQYALRDAIRLLVSVMKNPQARGTEDVLANAMQMLLDWDKDAG